MFFMYRPTDIHSVLSVSHASEVSCSYCQHTHRKKPCFPPEPKLTSPYSLKPISPAKDIRSLSRPFANLLDHLLNTKPIPPKTPRTMKLEDLDILYMLGQGTFGDVYLVKDTLTNTPLALKVIPKTEDDSDIEIGAVLNEQQIMKALGRLEDTTQVVPLVASFHDENAFYLVMERLSSVTFLDRLVEEDFNLPRSTAVQYMSQIVCALYSPMLLRCRSTQSRLYTMLAFSTETSKLKTFFSDKMVS